ncbi:MAG: putative transporter uptake transrane protein [Rhizobacter sp.]|nr:putative transporter uptake transrane protein [Rhizobacter sp.]
MKSGPSLHRDGPPPRPWRALWAVAWLAGVGLHLQQRTLWPAAQYGMLALCAVAALAGVWITRRRGDSNRVHEAGVDRLTATSVSALRLITTCLAFAALGFAASGWRAGDRLSQRLAANLEGQDVVVTGVVSGLPRVSAAGVQFRFEVERASWRDGAVSLPGELWLGWWRNDRDSAAITGLQTELRAGQRWRFTVRLKQPHGTFNPHGFDRELWLFEQNLRATGSVRVTSDAPPRPLNPSSGHTVARLRQWVRDAIDAQVADHRAAGVLAALAVGDQGAIDSDDWELFRRTGVSHLMAISGVHVTMFAWLVGRFVALLWRRSTRLALHLPAPTAGAAIGLLAACAYAVFSGGGLPAQRTVWMLAVAFALRQLSRRWPWPLVLLTAAVVVSAFDPWALLQPGFWLSFMAVGLLMASGDVTGPRQSDQAVSMAATGVFAGVDDAAASAPPSTAATPTRKRFGGPDWLVVPPWPIWWHHLRNAAQTGLRAQFIATVGLAPLAIVFFQQLSLVGFLANLVAIPVITLLVTPLALVGVIAHPLWNVAAVVLAGFDAFLQTLSAWPHALWSAPVAPLWAQMAGLAAAALAIARLPWRLRLLALPLAIPLLWPAVERPPLGRFDLLAADVGQGTAVLVRTRHHVLLYDTGPQYSADSDAGERVLLPLLRAFGEPRLDLMVLSHSDLDHIGGAAAIAQGVDVDRLLSSLDASHRLMRHFPHHERCEAGQSWTWDGVRFDVLHPTWPDGASLRAAQPPSNAASVRQAEPPPNPEGGAKAAARGAALPKPNTVSCVLRITDDHARTALLTGDIERDQERKLVAFSRDQLAADVLIAPHHGSRTSSTAAFLDAVHPRVAVFQAGYLNRFGHPAPDVVQRYLDRGIETLSSPTCGAWRWQGEQGVCERSLSGRYWNHSDRERSK